MSMYTFAAGIVGTIFAIWCSYQVMGRRPMVIFGTAGAVVCMFAAALGGTISPGSPEAAKNFMAWNVIYSVVYGGFAATIAWPISAEVVSSRLRVLTLSVATGIDYIFACKSCLLFLPRGKPNPNTNIPTYLWESDTKQTCKEKKREEK